ncbi:MAG TPA: hypothetical protein VMU11_03370 [Verrucomicrobiae bacterium]|nr:hypothetical protein [Verrucomicrobiae bacterium]
MQPKLAEAVFWLHLFLVACVLSLGLWFSVWMVLAVMFMHRLQFMAFRGCLLSKLQNRLQPFPEGMGFLQYAWFRFTGIRISAAQENVLDAVLVCTPIVVALMR